MFSKSFIIHNYVLKKITWQWNGHIRYYKDDFKKKSCLSTHVLGFFAWMCQCRDTMEGSHFSCLDIKEPQKNSLVPRFRQITTKNKGWKSKKNRKSTLFHVQVPMFGIFLPGCAIVVRQWRAAISHVWTSKNPKKIVLFPGSIK